MYDELAAGAAVEIVEGRHSLIKALMKEDGQRAGEMVRPHVFAHRWLGFDDAIYDGASLPRALSAATRPLHEARPSELPVRSTTP